MDKKTLTYYTWDQVQEFLCQHMGINTEEFRNYHGANNQDHRDQKDFWLVWLWIVHDHVYNDTYSFVPYSLLGFDSEDREIVRSQLPLG